MSEETKPNLEPLTELEINKLIASIEESNDLESDLSRAVFTIIVLSKEYQDLYTTLQAYYSAGAAACHDLAGACAQVIGLRDMKKVQKLYKLAGEYAGNIPARAQALLESTLTAQEEAETTTEEEVSDEQSN
jgi:hypothetical protein